jgi:uncharacterized RDD family membrane protein YckC
MRCPKCHYLSFEPDPRCKNCGYDLDIDIETDETDAAEPEIDLRIAPVAMAAAPDLPLRSVQPPARPVTLELVHASAPAARAAGATAPPAPMQMVPVAEPVLASIGAVTEPLPEPARRAPARSTAPTTELPLFVKTMGPQELGAFAGLALADREVTEEPEVAEEDERAEDSEDAEDVAILAAPPVHLPPATRPLSVRRPMAETARTAPRIERRPGPMDNDLLEDLQRLEREEAIRGTRRPMAPAASVAADLRTYLTADIEAGSPVAISHRLGAAAFDGLLLGGIGAFVLWATLKVADASPSSLGAAALVPMGVFVAAVGVAYLLMFTAAGGQTVGKMLTGIRVVNEDDSLPNGDRVTLGQAAGRAILAPLSVAMLGLGWLPAVFGRGQAFHDRLVHTRVVRA